MYLETPYVLAVDDSPAKNLLRQVAVPSAKLDGTLTPFTAAKIQGWLFQPLGSTETILIVPPKTKPAKVPNNHARVIAATVTNGPETLVDVTEGTWLRHPQLGDGQPRKEAQKHKKVLDSWMAPFRTSSKTPTLTSSACGRHNSERCMQFTLIGMSRRLQRLWSCRPERARRRRCSRFSSQHSATGYS